jgi:hypothetical protein
MKRAMKANIGPNSEVNRELSWSQLSLVTGGDPGDPGGGDPRNNYTCKPPYVPSYVGAPNWGIGGCYTPAPGGGDAWHGWGPYMGIVGNRHPNPTGTAPIRAT